MHNVLQNIERLKVLRDLNMLSKDFNTIYDRITAIASEVVAADSRFFKSYHGLPAPWASRRSTPLSHSFCQHVVTTSQPLIVSDAREVDFLKKNRAIPDLDVIGYLGMPLTLENGQTMGSFCVIDSQPRAWTQEEIDIVNELAHIVTHEIDMRVAARLDETQRPALDAYINTIEDFLSDVDADMTKERFLAELRALRQQIG